jgi:hypothetical protein
MKVVFVNTLGTTGGAAIAARRAMQAVSNFGVETAFVSMYKPAENDLIPPPKAKILRQAVMAAEIYSYVLRAANPAEKFIFSPARFGLNVASLDFVKQADVIHLHWVTQGMLSLRQLQKILAL